MFDWFWTTKRWIRDNFRFYSIIQGIKNLIQWFPLIYNDRDFDYGYLYNIIYFKLNNMQKFFESGNTFVVGAEEHAKEIKECKELLKRIMDEAVWDENWDIDKGFTKPLDKIEILDRQEKELFWNNMCKWIDGWWE